jgi:hypothetical protein
MRLLCGEVKRLLEAVDIETEPIGQIDEIPRTSTLPRSFDPSEESRSSIASRYGNYDGWHCLPIQVN